MRKWIIIAALALTGASSSPPAVPPPEPSQATREDRQREAAELRRDLAELRARLTEAEGNPSKDEEQRSELRQLRAELASLRQQLQAVRSAASVRELAIDQSIAELVAVSHQLASGEATGLEQRLDAAEDPLGRLARADLADVRAALSNQDLAKASLMLSQAIFHARQER